MLEPCDAKVSRTVLRGLGDRKVARLLGKLSCTVLRGLAPSNGGRLLGYSSTPPHDVTHSNVEVFLFTIFDPRI